MTRHPLAFLHRWSAARARASSAYVIRHRIVVDDESFRELTHRINNPRPPNEELLALFRSKSMG